MPQPRDATPRPQRSMWRGGRQLHGRADCELVPAVPTGNEFRVNTTTTNDQSEASVASLTNGGFVVTCGPRTRTGPTTSTAALRCEQEYVAAKRWSEMASLRRIIRRRPMSSVSRWRLCRHLRQALRRRVRPYLRQQRSGGTEFKVNTAPATSRRTRPLSHSQWCFIVTWHA